MTGAAGLSSAEQAMIEAMAAVGALPDRPFRTCTDSLGVAQSRSGLDRDSLFAAMVGLSSVGGLAVPLVDEHGNFGGLGFGPAEPEYLEARLSPAGLLAATWDPGRDFFDLVNGGYAQPMASARLATGSLLAELESQLDLASTDRGPAARDPELAPRVDAFVQRHRDELSADGLDRLRAACRPVRRNR